MPSTITLPRRLLTSITRLCLPLYLPVSTTTRSFLRTWVTLAASIFFSVNAFTPIVLNNLRRERNNLHKFFLAQFAGNRSKHACADRFAIRLDKHCGILIKADICAVTTAHLFASAHNHRLDYLTLLNRTIRTRLFNRCGDDIAQRR